MEGLKGRRFKVMLRLPPSKTGRILLSVLPQLCISKCNFIIYYHPSIFGRVYIFPSSCNFCSLWIYFNGKVCFNMAIAPYFLEHWPKLEKIKKKYRYWSVSYSYIFKTKIDLSSFDALSFWTSNPNKKKSNNLKTIEIKSKNNKRRNNYNFIWNNSRRNNWFDFTVWWDNLFW